MSERAFPQGSRGHPLHLDEKRLIRLKPDVSWWEGSACRFVGDLKYKRLDASGVVHSDLYQLLTYSVAAGLPGGLLVYAAGEAEPKTHRIAKEIGRAHV